MVLPRPDRFASLAPPEQTRVARIFVVAGQAVAKGDPLIEFERAPFEAAAQSAAAALANAERAYARAVRLVQAGVLAQKDSGQAAADLAAAQAAAVTARRAQELATLRAPLNGVVTRMSAVLGASVDANQTMVEVADPMALDIVFNVSPAEASRIHRGDTATVTSGEGTSVEALGPGVVTSIGVAVDSASRAVAVRARLTAPRRRGLDGVAAPVRHLPGAAVPAYHDRRPGLDTRRAPGRVQYHTAARGSREHRARRNARPLAFGPRRQRDLDYVRARDQHGSGAATGARPREPGPERASY